MYRFAKQLLSRAKKQAKPISLPYFAPAKGINAHTDPFCHVRDLYMQDDTALHAYLRDEQQYLNAYWRQNRSLHRSIKAHVESLCARPEKANGWRGGHGEVDIVGMEWSDSGHLYVTVLDESRSDDMPLLLRMDAEWFRREDQNGLVKSSLAWLKEMNHGQIVQWYRKLQSSNAGTLPDVPLRMVFDAKRHLRNLFNRRGVVQVQRLRMNDTEDMLACILSIDHGEMSLCAVIDIDSSHVVDVIDHCNVANAEFSADGRSVYYTISDQSTQQIFAASKRNLGTTYRQDQELYREDDAAFFVDLHKSKDKRFVTINAHSKTSSEVRILQDNALHLVRPRIQNRTYFVEHNGDEFFILNNGDDRNYYPNLRVQTVKNAFGGKAFDTAMPWRDFYVPSDPTTKIEDMDMFKSHMALYVKHRGRSEVRVVDIDLQRKLGHDGAEQILHLPDEVCTVDPGANNQFHTNHFMFSCSSPITPDTLYAAELSLDKSEEHQVHEFPQFSSRYHFDAIDFDHKKFEIRRLWALAENAMNIPITVVCRKDVELNGQHPLLLIGYGAYGESLECRFEPQRLYLLQKAGFVIAFAHVRGGSELGDQWHDAGRVRNKPNSFQDFVTCAQYLVDQGYTNPNLLSAKGVSSGGLLVAAAANKRPDLFRTILLKVPFLDISTIMQDPSLPLTEHEYDEFGNVSEDKNLLTMIKEYSPYDNVPMYKPQSLPAANAAHPQPSTFPSIYATASIDDFRAPAWNVIKYIMKHRWNQRVAKESKMTDTPVSPLALFKLDAQGHIDDAGMSGTYESIAQEYAFLLDNLKSREL